MSSSSHTTTHQNESRANKDDRSTHNALDPSTRPTPLLLQRAYAAPDSLTPTDVLQLQRTIGNQATIGLLSKSTQLQTKLKLGPAGDQYEQEADRVAEQVVRQIDSSPPVQRSSEEDKPVQAKFSPYGNITLQRAPEIRPKIGFKRTSETKIGQTKPLATSISHVHRVHEPQPKKGFVLQREGGESEELTQRKPLHGPEGGEVEQSVEQQIQRLTGGGQPLHENLQRTMGQAMAVDFSGVRVHTDSVADNLNQSLQAKAFTKGQDIFFRHGEYSPGSRGGQKLIAHELTHVVQQKAAQSPVAEGVAATRMEPTLQRKIGYEVETGIPITKIKQDKDNKDHYFDIYASKHKINMTGGIISPDHVPIKRTKPQPDNEHFDDIPIVEFVSDAIDEDLSDEDFKKWANDSMDQLKDIRDDAQADSPPGNNTLCAPYNFGLPSDGITYTDRNWNRISVQATLDVGLAKVGKLVGSHGSGGQTLTGTEIDQAQIAQRAGSVAESVLKAYEKNHWGQKKKSGRAEVKGLVTMMVHHLLIGADPRAQKMIYAKNRLGGVMYKTKLSTLVNGLAGNAYWMQILAKNTRPPKLINHMIALSNRQGTEPVYLGYTDIDPKRRGTDDDRSSAASAITVATWLTEVVSGTDDSLFDELKNEWSEEITPPSGIAAVEVRKPQSFLRPELGKIELSLDDPEGVTDYLLEIYKWNQGL